MAVCYTDTAVITAPAGLREANSHYIGRQGVKDYRGLVGTLRTRL